MGDKLLRLYRFFLTSYFLALMQLFVNKAWAADVSEARIKRLYQEAQASSEKGDYDEAIAFYNKAILITKDRDIKQYIINAKRDIQRKKRAEKGDFCVFRAEEDLKKEIFEPAAGEIAAENEIPSVKYVDGFDGENELKEEKVRLEAEQRKLDAEKKEIDKRRLEAEEERLRIEKILNAEKARLEIEKEKVETDKKRIEDEKRSLEQKSSSIEEALNAEKARLEIEKEKLETDKKQLEAKERKAEGRSNAEAESRRLVEEMVEQKKAAGPGAKILPLSDEDLIDKVGAVFDEFSTLNQQLESFMATGQDEKVFKREE